MISIIGSGKVGCAIAFLCGSLALDDIILVNRSEKKAIGAALDISNTIPATSPISINGTSDYSKIRDSEIVVITASTGIHLQTRAELMYDHATMIREISQNIAKYAPEAKILMITNPVDVLTYVIQKDGNFPSKHVIGVASSLDSGRFRYLLSREFGTNQSRITDAIVLGEHDYTMVPIFSHAKFNGKPVDEILDEQKKSKITNEVRNYWKYFREYQTHSVFGIAKNTFDIIKCMVKNETLNVPASILLDGQYGISNVCIGVPLEINKNGVAKIHQIKITEHENISLHKSAEAVRNNMGKVLEFLKAN